MICHFFTDVLPLLMHALTPLHEKTLIIICSSFIGTREVQFASQQHQLFACATVQDPRKKEKLYLLLQGLDHFESAGMRRSIFIKLQRNPACTFGQITCHDLATPASQGSSAGPRI